VQPIAAVVPIPRYGTQGDQASRPSRTPIRFRQISSSRPDAGRKVIECSAEPVAREDFMQARLNALIVTLNAADRIWSRE